MRLVGVDSVRATGPAKEPIPVTLIVDIPVTSTVLLNDAGSAVIVKSGAAVTVKVAVTVFVVNPVLAPVMVAV